MFKLQVYTRLNKLGMCVSHKKVIRLVKKLGKDHDQPILRWKEAVEGRKNTWSQLAEHHPEQDEESEPSNATSDEESIISISENPNDNCDTLVPLRYILTGDNINKNVPPRDMTLQHQTKSFHYFHTYAALSRIDFTGLSKETPTSRLLQSLDTAASYFRCWWSSSQPKLCSTSC